MRRQVGTDLKLTGQPPAPRRHPPSATARAAALHTARACRLEGDFSLPDCSAVWHVAVKRERLLPALRGRGWLAVLLDYTRLYERRSARARATQRLPWGDVPGWPSGRNAAWLRLRQHAVEVVAGRVADPCPAALHWRGPAVDVLPPNMRPARCRQATANEFLALARVR